MGQEKLQAALDIIAKSKKPASEIIDERLEQLRNLNIMEEIKSYDGFDEIVSQLTSTEKGEVEEQAEVVTEMYSDVLEHVANLLKDQETREKIIEEFKRRVG